MIEVTSALHRSMILAALVVVAVPGIVRAQPPRYAGRPLTDVLRELQGQGLRLIYTSEIVRPEMRVQTEPAPAGPRQILDSVLAPHGLAVQAGPSGTLLIVRSPPLANRDGLPGGMLTGGVTGTVVDARTGVPLGNVVVTVPGRAGQVLTDDAGAFSMSGLPAGRTALFVSLVGYTLARPAIEVRPGAVVTVVVPLADGTSTYTERITVTGDPFRGASPTAPAARTMRSAEVQKLRGVLADDPFRAVQSLPGVASGNDLRSEFSVRGSDFRHMGMSIDGLPTAWLVHNVQHYESKGSLGLLNSDVVDSLTILAGAHAQDHPGRTGAWLDVRMREGSRAATGLRAAVSMTSAAGVAEGPLGSDGRGSWLVSFRQSYVQWLIERLQIDDTSFGFTDAHAKVVFDVTPRQQLRLGAVAGRSRLDQTIANPGPAQIGVGTSTLGLAWLGWRSTFSRSLIVDQRIGLVAGAFENTHASGRVLATGHAAEPSYAFGLTWAPRSSLTLQTNALVQRQRAKQDQVEPGAAAGLPDGRRTEHVDGAAWTSSVEGRLTWGSPSGWGLDGGARAARSTLTAETTVSPWMTGSLPLGRRLSLRAGASVAHQVPDFDQVVGTFGQSDARSERAHAVDVTLELRPLPSTRVQAVFYQRRETHVLRLEDSETRLVDGRVVFAASLTPAWQDALDGRARGVEIIAERRAVNGVGGWIGYAYGRARYADRSRGESFWADLDQRHSFTLFAEGRLSPRTSVSVKLRAGSGFPVPGYLEERADGLFAGATRNAVRLPFYARLDLRADRTFNYQRRRLTLYAEVVNVLNRANYAADAGSFVPSGRAFGFTAKQFPILPSAGVLVEF